MGIGGHFRGAALRNLSDPKGKPQSLFPRWKALTIEVEGRLAGKFCARFCDAARERAALEAKELTAVDQTKKPVTIKKYANRRLYNTETSTYVTLDDLAEMVRQERDFVVYDAKSGEDLTHSVLTQIILERESRGQTLLPVGFLRQLIRFYGDSMQGMVPGYLEFSLGNLMKEQDKVRKQMMDAFGGDAFKAMEDAAKRNMQLFQDSLKMFTPFGANMPAGFPNPFAGASRPADKPAASASTSGPSKDELQSLKDQLAAMQEKIDQLNR